MKDAFDYFKPSPADLEPNRIDDELGQALDKNEAELREATEETLPAQVDPIPPFQVRPSPEETVYEAVYDPKVEISPYIDFGDAIRALKNGKRVARTGWNGKDMWLSLTPGSSSVPAANIWSPNNRQYAESLPGQVVNVLPAITMKTATGEILMGWLASQTDMLAEDWIALP